MQENVILNHVPSDLKGLAYYSANHEPAWSAVESLQVIHILSNQEIAIVGVEVWLPTKPGPTIPTPYIYGWEAGLKQDDQTWNQYVEASTAGARSYIESFEWDKRDIEHIDIVPYFNLTAVTEEDIEPQ